MSKNYLLDEYIAHKHSTENKSKLLENPQKCGCFSCKRVFTSDEITEYMD